ncbi:MAG: hypothetical protein JW828_05660 [Sedimentisphaerales bacterium]|nr:hypothetical protein [Sedimentisphaerales bacterium]
MYGHEGQNISVTTPVSRALERVNKILLDPFDLSKWFLIGFGAWLATLGRGGGGGVNFHIPSGGSGGGPGNMDHAVREIMPYLPIIIISTVGIALLIFGVKVLLLWLNSRGDFMFVHCIVLNKGQVKEPWTQFREQGNSLFLFRLAINVVCFYAF